MRARGAGEERRRSTGVENELTKQKSRKGADRNGAGLMKLMQGRCGGKGMLGEDNRHKNTGGKQSKMLHSRAQMVRHAVLQCVTLEQNIERCFRCWSDKRERWRRIL